MKWRQPQAIMKDEKRPDKLPYFIIHSSSFSQCPPVSASGKPVLFASVYSWPSLASFITSVKATSALEGLPIAFKDASTASL